MRERESGSTGRSVTAHRLGEVVLEGGADLLVRSVDLPCHDKSRLQIKVGRANLSRELTISAYCDLPEQPPESHGTTGGHLPPTLFQGCS